jgi:hypothetical protein
MFHTNCCMPCTQRCVASAVLTTARSDTAKHAAPLFAARGRLYGATFVGTLPPLLPSHALHHPDCSVVTVWITTCCL